METAAPPLALASASPRRRDLLAQIGVEPALIVAPDIDETPHPGELPRAYALRMAAEKCARGAELAEGHVTLAADTVVALGRRILPKAEDEETARTCLELISGRRHRVVTGVALLHPDGRDWTRAVETRLKVKRLSHSEIADYLASGEWRGKAGGYGAQGRAAMFIPWLSGSYSNVVGLPLAETAQLLAAAGLRW